MVYCLLHYSGNTTNFTFLVVVLCTSYAVLRYYLQLYYNLHIFLIIAYRFYLCMYVCVCMYILCLYVCVCVCVCITYLCPYYQRNCGYPTPHALDCIYVLFVNEVSHYNRPVWLSLLVPSILQQQHGRRK